MPTPINFSLVAALQTNLVRALTTIIDYPGGYNLLSWQFTGMGSGVVSAYENAANKVTSTVYFSIDGGVTYNVYSEAVWSGGAITDKNGITDPAPIMSVGLGNLPACKVYVQIVTTGTFLVGISNGTFT